MPLFNDGPINTEQDLQTFETSVLDVASVEGIDLGAKAAIAQDEIGTDILAFLLRRETAVMQPGFIGLPSMLRRKVGTGDVVVTPPLKRWHALLSLARTYRDAYNNQLNDRYQGKWKAYEQDASVAADRYMQIGVGLVGSPLPVPSIPGLSFVAGSGAGANYFVSVTWLNATGQESAPSQLASLTVGTGAQLLVTAPAAPSNAVSWNVYAGSNSTATMLQNAAPIALGQSWTQPPGVPAQGVAPGAGQSPDRYLVNDRLMQRG